MERFAVTVPNVELNRYVSALVAKIKLPEFAPTLETISFLKILREICLRNLEPNCKLPETIQRVCSKLENYFYFSHCRFQLVSCATFVAPREIFFSSSRQVTGTRKYDQLLNEIFSSSDWALNSFFVYIFHTSRTEN